MAEFEVEVAGWVRVIKRYRVTSVDDSEAASEQALRDATDRTPWRRGYFKVDPRSAPRSVEIVKGTPLNQKSAEAERAAKEARGAPR